MRILTIDTSAVASAAVLDFDPLDPARTVRVVANFATADTRSHAEVLAPGVKSLFTDPVTEGPELDAIIVGTGPGPFTGLRSGITVARTLAFTWGVPLYGMMSLDALAQQVFATPRYRERARRGAAWPWPSLWLPRTPAARRCTGPDTAPGPCCWTARMWVRRQTFHGVQVFGAGAGIYARCSQATAAWWSPASREEPAHGPATGPGGRPANCCRRIPARTPASRTPPRCTCANPTPRCPGPGSGRCESARTSRAGRPKHARPAILRTMVPADIDFITALDAQLFGVDCWPRHMFVEELAQPETRRYIIAEVPDGDGTACT